jgi:hypothetical protein
VGRLWLLDTNIATHNRKRRNNSMRQPPIDRILTFIVVLFSGVVCAAADDFEHVTILKMSINPG